MMKKLLIVWRASRPLLLLFLLLFASAVAAAENWPHWRGPRRDGTSTETKLPVKWSQTENVVWRLPLPGEAAATPVVWGDRIFVTSTSGENLLVLLCISKDGKILWQRTAGSGHTTVKGDEGNFAAPSPSTDGKYVWVFFGTGDLVCYDFNGKQIWKTNLQQRYGKFNLYFVMASSPLLDGNRLYVQLIHSDASLVLALDKGTGSEIWKHQRTSDARDECKHSYASPFVYRDGKNEFLLVHGADYITAHSLSDGREIWRCGGLNPKDRYNPSLRFVASPVAISGLIIVPSAKNGPVLGLSADGKGDITDNSQSYVWKLVAGTPDVPSPLIHDGVVYLCGENGDLTAVDAKTGKKLYLEHTHQSRHRASPVYGDGKIYITSRDGMITVVKAGRQFEILAQNDLAEPIAASPVISNGRLYIRTYKALYSIAAK
jgi:outer membrane protein assembly factor BamB